MGSPINCQCFSVADSSIFVGWPLARAGRATGQGRSCLMPNRIKGPIAFCGLVICAFFTAQTVAHEKQTLELVQTIPLPGVKGRLDHMGLDVEQKRLFLAAVDNQTLEV